MKQNKTRGFFSDWQVKILCLIVAVLVYFSFSFGIPSERKVTMPLNIMLPEGLEVTSNMPESVDVIVRGNEKQIYMVDVSRIKLYADFTDVKNEGVASVPVVIDYSELLDFISITDLTIYTDPSLIKLYFEVK